MIAFMWFQSKRSDIEYWVVMVITVYDSMFYFCILSGYHSCICDCIILWSEGWPIFMSYSGVCSLSSFSNCAVVISGISFAGFDILFLFMLIFF